MNKVMGLAGYGRPTLVNQVRKLVPRTSDGAFTLDLDYFEFHTTAEHCYSSRFIELFGPPRSPCEPIDLETAEGQRYADCAASVQPILEVVCGQNRLNLFQACSRGYRS